MTVLYLIRGISGSGKTTFAKTLNCSVFSADDYFMCDGQYKFCATNLPLAHRQCQIKVDIAMCCLETVAVANTFTREWEIEPYLKLAKIHGYTVFSIIVENRHGGKNSHGVSEDKIQEMRDRFEIKL